MFSEADRTDFDRAMAESWRLNREEHAEELAAPAEVYLDGAGKDAMVSFVYPASARLPETGAPGVGALLSQFPGETERGFTLKGLGLEDAGAGTILEAVPAPGDWKWEIAPEPFAETTFQPLNVAGQMGTTSFSWPAGHLLRRRRRAGRGGLSTRQR